MSLTGKDIEALTLLGALVAIMVIGNLWARYAFVCPYTRTRRMQSRGGQRETIAMGRMPPSGREHQGEHTLVHTLNYTFTT